MDVPKGNTLFEHENLTIDDVNILLTNLEQQGFTGYVKTEFTPALSGILFYNTGTFVRALELEDGNVAVHPKARILNRIKSADFPTSVYVLSAQMVSVISGAFAFQKLYVNVEAKRKEIKKIREGLENEEQSGMMEFLSRDGTIYTLVDRGKMVFDQFAREYGQVLCGVEDVNRAFEQLGKEGAVMNVYGEKYTEIDTRRRAIEEEMEKTRQLIAKTDTGLFKGADDVVKMDEYILKDWGLKASGIIPIELETSTGETLTVKCQPAKKVGQYLALSAKLSKRLNVREGDVISVRPSRRG